MDQQWTNSAPGDLPLTGCTHHQASPLTAFVHNNNKGGSKESAVKPLKVSANISRSEISGRVQIAKVHLLLCLLLLHSCSHSRLCPPHQKHPFVGTQNISAFHILLSARFPQDISYKLHRIQFLTQICVHLCQLCNGSASRSCSSVHKSNGKGSCIAIA